MILVCWVPEHASSSAIVASYTFVRCVASATASSPAGARSGATSRITCASAKRSSSHRFTPAKEEHRAQSEPTAEKGMVWEAPLVLVARGGRDPLCP